MPPPAAPPPPTPAPTPPDPDGDDAIERFWQRSFFGRPLIPPDRFPIVFTVTITRRRAAWLASLALMPPITAILLAIGSRSGVLPFPREVVFAACAAGFFAGWLFWLPAAFILFAARPVPARWCIVPAIPVAMLLGLIFWPIYIIIGLGIGG